MSPFSKGLLKGVTKVSLSEFDSRIFRLLIESSIKPTKIAELLKTSRKTIHKHISKMIGDGVLQRKSRGGYFPMGYHVKPDGGYRIHGVQVFYDLPVGTDKLKWKQNRGRVLGLKKIVYDRIILRNRFGITDEAPRFFVFDRYDARCHANGVMVYLPGIKAVSPFDAESELLVHIRLVGEELSRIFRLDFVKENTLRVRIINYHISHLKDATAEILRNDRKKLFVFLEGEMRVVCDYSWAVDEMEGITVDKGLPDIKRLQDFIGNILKEGDNVLFPSDIRKELSAVALNMKDLESILASLTKIVINHMGEK